MEYKDYYKILGVPRDASQKDIKAAFRKLARQYHPDVRPGDKAAEEHFKDINEANEVLSDPHKRQKYEAFGADWQRYQQAGGRPEDFDFSRWAAAGGAQGPGGERVYVHYASPDDLADLFDGEAAFSDFFATLFGGGAAPISGAQPAGRRSPQRGPQRGQDVEVRAQVSFDEAFHGTTRVLQLDGRRLEARIPAGVQSGSRIRLTGQAGTGAGVGGRSGDLYLVIEVAPDARFERRGDDLYAEAAVDFYIAGLGGEARLQAPDGAVALSIPPRTQAGKVFRLRGKGMPLLGRRGRGDLYARVKIVLPEDLSDEELQGLRDLAARRGGRL
jgi:curved DNA-binding protein